MIHRVAIFAASLVVALGLAVGLVVAGLAPGSAPGTVQPVSAPVGATEDPAPIVQVDTVYVAPRATPEDVVVTKVVGPARQDDDHGERDEHEGSDD